MIDDGAGGILEPGWVVLGRERGEARVRVPLLSTTEDAGEEGLAAAISRSG
jgi:hypothetical protein